MSREVARRGGASRFLPIHWRVWRPRAGAVVYQAIAAAAIGLCAWYTVLNTIENLQARGITSGFAFLFREAGFEISETTFLSYNAANTYLRALTVGVLNTFRVALIGITCATLLGTLVGLARLSRNWLVAKLTAAYVETIRNVPLLVQLFFWYAVVTEYLPAPTDALNPLPGIYISNRGIVFPFPGPHLAFEYPVLEGFNFSGGGALSPEFAALLLGLVIYTAAFIGEIVRAGILSVHRGQFEAARSTGLSSRETMRFVILPQALRAIVPPLTSQYLNIAKNSSLAVAIGYPDLVSVANTTINQTGQAIEGIVIIMLVYLTISLALSALMNWYNRRMALKGGAL
jgi:general L-amino acid transport system permease protein